MAQPGVVRLAGPESALVAPDEELGTFELRSADEVQNAVAANVTSTSALGRIMAAEA
jgi:hypothetical protein